MERKADAPNLVLFNCGLLKSEVRDRAVFRSDFVKKDSPKTRFA